MSNRLLQDAFVDRVKATMTECRMVQPGDIVVVGVSGGPDSMALLYVLEALKADMGFRISVAHLDHQLRADSAEDAQFVLQKATELGIGAHAQSLDVQKLARDEGVSVEEAGRWARYDFFEEVRREERAQSIATAHHMDDAIETFFLRLFRGSSLRGIGGIAPVSRGIVRPLIRSGRQDIERFVDTYEIAYRIDQTNLAEGSDRNYIRNRLLSVIRERFPHFSGSMQRTLELIRQEEDYLDHLAHDAYSRSVRRDEEGVRMNIRSLLQEPKLIRARVLLDALYTIGGRGLRCTRTHVEGILRTIESDNPSSELSLPQGLKVRRQYDEIFIGKDMSPAPTTAPIIIEGPGVIDIPWAGMKLSVRIMERGSQIPAGLDGTQKVCFDGEQIVLPLSIRAPEPGDRVQPWGTEGTRKLKKILIDLKVPVTRRARIPLLVQGETVLWVIGIRRSSIAPVTGKTQRILEISLVE